MDQSTVEVVATQPSMSPLDIGNVLRSVSKGNPMAEMVGWCFESFDPELKELSLSFTPQSCFCNVMGMIHGGFVATMLDEVMGSTMFAVSGGRQIGATISATVDFIRPAMLGKVFATGRVRSFGKSIAFVDGELADPERKLLAKATASFKIVDMPQPR